MPRIIKSAKGTFTASTVTIDGTGRVIAAASGSGGANMQLVRATKGPASGNFVANPNASKFQAYVYAPGGGGGGGGGRNSGGSGGAGGFGFFSGDVTGGTTYAFAIPAGGTGGAGGGGTGSSGSAGSACTIANLVTTNGGNGGNGGFPQTDQPNGNSGTDGSAPGAETENFTRGFLWAPSDLSPTPLGNGGSGGPGPANGTPQAGTVGGPGGIILYENSH